MTQLIDTLATVHYPAGLVLAAFALTIATLPTTWKKARS